MAASREQRVGEGVAVVSRLSGRSNTDTLGHNAGVLFFAYRGRTRTELAASFVARDSTTADTTWLGYSREQRPWSYGLYCSSTKPPSSTPRSQFEAAAVALSGLAL